VADLLKQRIPATLVLSALSILFALCIAIPLGVLAAIFKDSLFDRLSSIFAYAALSIPEFFLALLAVMFAANTGLFPVGGLTSMDHEFMPFWSRMADYAHHLVLPTLVLGMGSVASYMRIMRANFLDYIRADFVTTARAKGVGEGRVMFVHVLRNAINPLVSASGFILASLLSGSILVENVMNYPGLGQLIFEALMRQDEFVVVAAVLMGCIMLMLGNLIADLLLAWFDPRIRLDKN
jgi:peptide/nickel transport system permease protein